MELQAVIIGYKNHARRIIDIVISSKKYSKIYIYHPDIKKLSTLSSLNPLVEITDKFSDLNKCSCFYISSPSETHFYYIEKIYKLFHNTNKKYYIYCEKPIAVNEAELNWLKTRTRDLYKKIYVGFNQNHSQFSSLIKKCLTVNNFGKPIYANFEATHGLAFKKEAANNWRFVNNKTFSKLLGNLAIHFIFQSLSFFGDVENFFFSESYFTEKKNSDTNLLTLRHKNGVTTSIFISYASIYSKRSVVFFEDATISRLNDREILISTPRDTFDESGEFTAPRSESITADDFGRNVTLKKSIDYFIDKSTNKKEFKKTDFDLAVKTSELVLAIEKNYL